MEIPLRTQLDFLLPQKFVYILNLMMLFVFVVVDQDFYSFLLASESLRPRIGSRLENYQSQRRFYLDREYQKLLVPDTPRDQYHYNLHRYL